MIKDKNIMIVHVVVDVNGGIGSVVSNLINYQLEQGYMVGLVCAQYYQPFYENLDKRVKILNINVSKIPGAYMLFGMKINSIYNIIKKSYKDKKIILHTHNVATVGLVANVKKIPMICTIHGISRNGITSIRGKISDYLYRIILRNMRRHNKTICAVSCNTANYYNKFLKEDVIVTVHNGVNTVKTKTKSGMFTIGHIGDLSRSKGWDTTYNAYKNLPDKYKNMIKFKFAGKIIDISEDEINNMINEDKLENAIYLGQVPNASSEVIPYLDILILASISEGLPMVILEAQSLGIPVIATNVGGIGEVIIDGVNGFLVNKDYNEIKDKIIELYDNKIKYNLMKDASKSIYKKNYSVNKMGEKYDYIYNHIS